MKVCFYQKPSNLWFEQIKKLQLEFPDVEFITDCEKDESHLMKADIIIGGKLPENIIKNAEMLKLIVVPFAGVNHLPFHILKKKQIRAANSHGNAWQVAERTIAMILAFYGKIIEYHKDMQEGQWHGFWVGRGLDDTWESIRGKTCSILGTGEIGRHIALLLKAFDVGIIGLKNRPVNSLPEYFDRIVYSIDEAIGESEIIIIALPSTPETRGIIDENALEKMKGKFLVNIGRGDIVDERALYDALKSGSLRGAAIDCWYTYPEEGTVGEPSRYPINKLPNIVLSPHVAGFSHQAAVLNIEHACENIRRFLKSGELLYEVDTEKGY